MLLRRLLLRSLRPLRLPTLAALGLSCLLTQGLDAQTPSAEELVERGRQVAAGERPAQAIPYFEQAADLLARAGRTTERAEILNETGVVRFRLGELDLAEDLYRSALEIQEGVPEGTVDTALATTLNNLAALQLRRGHPEAAEPHYRRALELRQRALGPQHPDVAFSLTELATLCHGLGRLDEAIDLYTRALAIEEVASADDPGRLVPRLTNLAVLHRLQGDPEAAEALMGRAVSQTEAALGPDHPEVAAALNNQAVLASDLERWDQAEALYRRALEIQRKIFGESHFSLAMSLRNLASLYLRQGRNEEAVVATRQMDAVLDANCDLDRGLERTADQRTACRDARLMHRQLARQLQLGDDGSSAPPATPPVATPSTTGSTPPPPPAAGSAPPPVPTTGPVYRAQVKAYQERSHADGDVPHLIARFPALLSGVRPHVVRADLGDKGIWYRIQFGDFPTQGEASRLCRALEEAGHDGCWVVRARGGDG